MTEGRKAEPTDSLHLDPRKGLFRTALAGRGRSLREAFASLESSSHVEKVERHAGHNLFGARVNLTAAEGEGYWEFTRIRDDIYIVVENFAYKDPRVEILPGDGLVQFYFKLTGDLTMGVTHANPLRLNRPSLLIYRQPNGIEIDEWTAPSARERCVAIYIRPQFLVDTFVDGAEDVPPQLHSLMFAASDSKIEYCQLPLRAQMYEVASKLVDSPSSGALGLVYREALALELLCVAMDGVRALTGSSPSEQYSQRELRCLQTARHMLAKRLAEPPTIRQVARTTGLSETTLKKGFKAIYGETIFDYSLRCRMQQALSLLRDECLKVNQVAEAVGFRHATSFATSFRRHFGIRPKDMRLSRRR
jgi:AraC-like DNA-binding protein